MSAPTSPAPIRLILPPLALDAEQSDALAAAVTAANAAKAAGTPAITAASYLAGIVNGHLDGLVVTAYQASVAELGSAAAGLPYAERKTLIAQVKAALPPA